MTDITRREFVKVGAAGAAALAIGATGAESAAPMPERPLGKTGFKVRIFSLGGQAAIETAGMHDESIAIINRAIDLGRELHRHGGRLRARPQRHAALGSQRHQPDQRRRGDEDAPQRGLPREQDRRPHARRLAEAARAEPEAAQYRPPRPLAAAQHHARRSARPDLRQGRRHRGAAAGARSEDGPLPRDHRPLRPGCPAEGHRALPVRRDPDRRSTRPTNTTCRSPPRSSQLPARSRWASSG